MIPRLAELERAPWERDDPLGEEDHSPLPGLVHTYPDKVLFLVTDFCATFCRYCTRARMVGSGEFLPDRDQWTRALEYIQSHPEIRDVLLSGGDPLVLADDRLEWLLSRIAAIPHVEIIRIGTKIPAVLPQRVTSDFTDMLKKYHPLWMSIHFTHVSELTAEVEQACSRLAAAGVPMMSQTVLLAGVNDSPEAMRDLNQKLLQFRVKPYYLHQCDAITGSAHFKTPVSKGVEIVQALHGWTTGYAVPHFMIDAPGGGGEIALHAEAVQGVEDDDLLLKNYRGNTYRYPDLAG
jgi:lysine 2,3-aminomutase